MCNPRPSRSIRLAIAISLVVATIAGSLYWLLYLGPMQLITHGKKESIATAESLYALAQRLGADLKRELKLQPHVIVNNRTVLEASNDIVELATREQTFLHDHVVETTWLGSSKRLHVRGHFKAKAGFDLKDALRLEISEDHKTIRVFLPPARLLSLEQTDIELVQDENGYWNKITKEQREQALKELQFAARNAAEESTILREARESWEKQLRSWLEKQCPEFRQILIDPIKDNSRPPADH